MIYGLFGFPEMGVAGAALATVIGQIIAFIAGIILNHKFNHEVRLNMRSFRPDGAIIKNIYAVGVPSIIMGSIGSVMTVGINQIVRLCGAVADTAPGGVRRIFQAAKLCVYAGIRLEQWHGADHCVQLWRQKA